MNDEPDEVLYSNPWVAVELKDGMSRVKSGKGAGVIAVVTAEDHILMVRQRRHPFHELMWELPRGGWETGSGAENTAREVFEETGIEIDPSRFSYIATIAPDSGLLTTKVEIHRTWLDKKVDDFIPEAGHEPKWVPFDEVLAHLFGECGTIDSMSLAALKLCGL